MSRTTTFATLLALGVTSLDVPAGPPAPTYASGRSEDPTADVLVVPSDAAAVRALLARRSNAELVALMRDPRIGVQKAVCTAVLERAGIDPDTRWEAATLLGGASGNEPVKEVVNALIRVDMVAATETSVMEELGELVLGRSKEELQPISGTILRVARYSRRDEAKEIGWAGYLVATGDASRTIRYAKTSVTRFVPMLRSLRRVRQRELLAGARAEVEEIARTNADTKVRGSAYRGLVACDPSVRTIDFLLPLTAEIPMGFAAVAALAEIPPADFPAERRAKYVEAFVAFAARQTPDRRVLIANRTRESWAHASAIASRLPPSEERTKLRAALDAVAVVNAELRTVRRELRFDRPNLEIPAASVVELVFHNRDDLPHNLVIVAPGSVEKVGRAADELSGQVVPNRRFVPELPEVIASTGVVQPHGRTTFVFVAPTEPGDYAYISTVGGHWPTVRGTLRVVAP